MAKKSSEEPTGKSPGSGNRGSKRAAIAHFQKNPKASIEEVMKEAGVSSSTANNAKKEMRLTRGRKPTNAVGKIDTESMKAAVSAAGGTGKLFDILSAVEKAGGVEAVKNALEQYGALKSVFG